ncbi:proliferating cell nuclear antigen [Galdieria sulphuraria]|uniref:DNA sliding clamp PCNA n=1 Tax=Galdieria sulphuraria TaxID=130081 RepID=M2WY47_GALSU|nr:proliferating cell nuclear antigen [Galdieria sulphuraria]EME28990.1 proliferating cell nuclear antigen [Galdieria sulphuraria]|eukprot:XP_005705510.1 proliferating cell nuclear antigen [Galdieria sulphuraria]
MVSKEEQNSLSSFQFEARLTQASLIKKILEAIKDLVTDANFDCSPEGLSLQAMDSSHVSLVSMVLHAQGFEMFRCQRAVSLGINLASLTKILKCAGNDDSITLRADEKGDKAEFVFESQSQDRLSEFELKLMDIDSEHLGIPDTKYSAIVEMPSSEYRRICSDLGVMGDTVRISVSKESVKFQVDGDIGKGSVCLHPSSVVDKPTEVVKISLEEPVDMIFSIRYLNYFAKAAPLSDTVTLSLSKDFPLQIEFKFGEQMGYLRYYLAPKID